MFTKDWRPTKMENHKTLTEKIQDWKEYIEMEKRKIQKGKVVPLKIFMDPRPEAIVPAE